MEPLAERGPLPARPGMQALPGDATKLSEQASVLLLPPWHRPVEAACRTQLDTRAGAELWPPVQAVRSLIQAARRTAGRAAATSS